MGVLGRYSDDELFRILDADVEDEIRSRGYEYGWYKRETYAGDIYILVNPAFSNLVKIGYADDVEVRVRALNSNSGLPDPYHVFATYRVKKRLEDLTLHRLIDTLDPTLRHARNREFYDMDAEKAYGILATIAEINGNEDLLVKNPLRDAFFDGFPCDGSGHDAGREESYIIASSKKIRRQPPFNFHEFGISDGELIEFFDARTGVSRPDIVARVAGGRSIVIDGETTSVSAAARSVLGLRRSPRGTEYWTWNGRRLVDIYQERYPSPKRKLKRRKAGV